MSKRVRLTDEFGLESDVDLYEILAKTYTNILGAQETYIMRNIGMITFHHCILNFDFKLNNGICFSKGSYCYQISVPVKLFFERDSGEEIGTFGEET